MSIAKKCDICGKLYEEYNTEFDPQNVNGFMFVNIDKYRDWRGDDPIDCCPECIKAIKNFVEKMKQQVLVETHLEGLRKKSSEDKSNYFTTIVIHRDTQENAFNAFIAVRSVILEAISPSFCDDDVLEFDWHKAMIRVKNIYIHFRYGDPCKMAAFHPNFYDTNSIMASEFLHQAASGVGGKELNSLSELIETIKTLL